MESLTTPCSKLFASTKRIKSVSAFSSSSSFAKPEILSFPSQNLDLFSSSSLSCHFNPIHCISTSASLVQENVETGEVVVESVQDLGAEECPTETTIVDSKTVHVRFQLRRECYFGEQFCIVGDDPIFGLWDPENAVPLNWSKGHVWTAELDVPVGRTIKFKLILKGAKMHTRWQPGPDRIFKAWETENTIIVSEDWDNAALQKIVENVMDSRFSDLLADLQEDTSEIEMTIIVDATSPAEDQTRSEEESAKTERMLVENSFGSNVIAVTEEKSTQDDNNLVNYDGGPVLVSGLTALSPTATEEVKPVLVSSLTASSPKATEEVKPVLVSGLTASSPKATEEVKPVLVSGLTASSPMTTEEVTPVLVSGLTALSPMTTEEVKPVLVPGLTALSPMTTEEVKPVLVPGLTALSPMTTEEVLIKEIEARKAVIASSGADDSEGNSMPKKHEKQELNGKSHQEESVETMFDNVTSKEEEPVIELSERSHFIEEERPDYQTAPVENTVEEERPDYQTDVENTVEEERPDYQKDVENTAQEERPDYRTAPVENTMEAERHDYQKDVENTVEEERPDYQTAPVENTVEEERPNFESSVENTLENDVQWGRITMRKILGMFGLPLLSD